MRTSDHSDRQPYNSWFRFRWFALFILLLIMLGLWRGWGLWDRGLLEHDEGHNMLAARTYSEAISWALSGAWMSQGGGGGLAQVRDVLHRQGGTLYDSGKPGFVGLLTIWSLVVGLGQKSALLFGWLGGMAVVVISAVIAQHWFGRDGDRWKCAIIAAVGVALSPLLGGLGREVGGTIWALAFGLAGIAALGTGTDYSEHDGEFAAETAARKSESRPRLRLVCAGVMFAVGFTCHYNLLPLVVSALFADVMLQCMKSVGATSRRFTACVRRLTWITTGGVIVIGFVQIVTWLADRRLASIYPEYEDYLSQLTKIVTAYQVPALMGEAVKEGARGWGMDAATYTGKVFSRENLLFFPLLVLASVLGAAFLTGRKRRVLRGTPRQREGLIRAVILLAGIVVFWVAHPWKVERSWGMVIAVAWLWMAGCLGVLLEQRQRAPRSVSGSTATTGISLVLVAVFIWSATASWETLWSRKSPVPVVTRQALRYVIANGGLITADSAAQSFAPLWKWTIIEEGRRSELRAALEHVDFSRFGSATIIFNDPGSSDDPEFIRTYWDGREKVLIAEETSQNPAWHVAAYVLPK